MNKYSLYRILTAKDSSMYVETLDFKYKCISNDPIPEKNHTKYPLLHHYAIMYNGDSIGYVQIEYEKEGIDIGLLGFDYRYQHKGHSKHALNLIIDLAKAQNMKYLTLEVEKDNPNALNAYLKFGFEYVDSYHEEYHDMIYYI
jgi:RimJ/RimL family protein N-acetyltransferase